MDFRRYCWLVGSHLDNVKISKNNLIQVNINIEIKNPGKKYIIQLLEENGERVLKEILISNSTTLKFDNLNPGKYKIKAIEDKNNNSKWDTGNYLKKIQPEKVYYFDKEINIRANWDVEEDWKL